MTRHVLELTDEARRTVMKANVGLAVLFAACIVGPVAGLQFALGRPALALPFLALAVSMVAGTAALARRFAHRTRIEFGDGVYRVGGLRGVREYAAHQISRAIWVHRMRLGSAPATQHLFVLGPKRRITVLVGQMFSVEQMHALATDLYTHRVEVITITEPTTSARLRGTDPRVMPWWQAHPVIFALLATVLLLIVLVVVFVTLVAIFVA